MNVVLFKGERVNTNACSMMEIERMKEAMRAGGESICTDSVTKLPVSLTVPHIRSGNVIVRAHANYLPGSPVIPLQKDFLFDPERMIDDWRGSDDSTVKRTDEYGDPIEYVAIGQAQNVSNRGESLLHINGNQDIREQRIGWIANEYGLSETIEGCDVVAEHQVRIPHRDNKRRIIDTALVDSNGVPRLAIEFQCSQLSSQQLHARISDYKAINLTQVWLLSGDAIKSGAMREVLRDHAVAHALYSKPEKFD